MENVEYFIIAPSVKLFGGIRVTKESEFKDVYNEDRTIKQSLKDLVLTTEVLNKEREDGAVKTVENAKLEQTLIEGIVLVYGEDTGYIIAPYKMAKVNEAIDMLNKIEEVTKPIETGTKKAIKNK